MDVTGLNSITNIYTGQTTTISRTPNYGVSEVTVTYNTVYLNDNNVATSLPYTTDSGLGVGKYTIRLSDVSNNYLVRDSFIVFGTTFYVSPTGTGAGTSSTDTTNLTYTLANAPEYGNIIFTTGTYDMNGLTLSKSYNLTGENGAIITGDLNS